MSEHLINRLEDTTGVDQRSEASVHALVSIAISLRRIADCLEGPERKAARSELPIQRYRDVNQQEDVAALPHLASEPTDDMIATLRETIEQMRNTVRLHANAIETEVNLISRAALEKSGGAE